MCRKNGKKFKSLELCAEKKEKKRKKVIELCVCSIRTRSPSVVHASLYATYNYTYTPTLPYMGPIRTEIYPTKIKKCCYTH